MSPFSFLRLGCHYQPYITWQRVEAACLIWEFSAELVYEWFYNLTSVLKSSLCGALVPSLALCVVVVQRSFTDCCLEIWMKVSSL